MLIVIMTAVGVTLGIAALVACAFVWGMLKVSAAEALLERERGYARWLELRDRQAIRTLTNGRITKPVPQDESPR